MDRRLRKRLLRDSGHAYGLGCGNCEDQRICGGLSVPNMVNCLDLCCHQPEGCDFVCPRDVNGYVEQVNSIGGFDPDDIPRHVEVEHRQIPFYVPLVYHKSKSRPVALVADAVGIELGQLIDFKSGDPKFTSRDQLANRFGIEPSSKLVVSGIADDPPLEKYWLARNDRFLRALASIEPDLVTTPNFSTFANVPRWTDLYNLKRIAICWSEFTRAGIPTALHLNGRTPMDWARWTEFIIHRSEVNTVAFEFATILGERKRIYVDRLLKLADMVPRRLRLVVRGGVQFLGELARVYDLVFIDTDPFIKANKRQIWHGTGGWISVADPQITEIDGLLQFNVGARKDKLRPLVLNE